MHSPSSSLSSCESFWENLFYSDSVFSTTNGAKENVGLETVQFLLDERQRDIPNLEQIFDPVAEESNNPYCQQWGKLDCPSRSIMHSKNIVPPAVSIRTGKMQNQVSKITATSTRTAHAKHVVPYQSQSIPTSVFAPCESKYIECQQILQEQRKSDDGEPETFCLVAATPLTSTVVSGEESFSWDDLFSSSGSISMSCDDSIPNEIKSDGPVPVCFFKQQGSDQQEDESLLERAHATPMVIPYFSNQESPFSHDPKEPLSLYRRAAGPFPNSEGQSEDKQPFQSLSHRKLSYTESHPTLAINERKEEQNGLGKAPEQQKGRPVLNDHYVTKFDVANDMVGPSATGLATTIAQVLQLLNFVQSNLVITALDPVSSSSKPPDCLSSSTVKNRNGFDSKILSMNQNHVENGKISRTVNNESLNNCILHKRLQMDAEMGIETSHLKGNPALAATLSALEPKICHRDSRQKISGLSTQSVDITQTKSNNDASPGTEFSVPFFAARHTISNAPPTVTLGSSPIIENPLIHDILLGRGHRSNKHAGNLRFRSFIKQFRDLYIGTTVSHKKTAITQTLLNMCKAPFILKGKLVVSRFLRFRKDVKGWQEVPDEIARRKIAHLLRSKTDAK